MVYTCRLGFEVPHSSGGGGDATSVVVRSIQWLVSVKMRVQGRKLDILRGGRWAVEEGSICVVVVVVVVVLRLGLQPGAKTRRSRGSPQELRGSCRCCAAAASPRRERRWRLVRAAGCRRSPVGTMVARPARERDALDQARCLARRPPLRGHAGRARALGTPRRPARARQRAGTRRPAPSLERPFLGEIAGRSWTIVVIDLPGKERERETRP